MANVNEKLNPIDRGVSAQVLEDRDENLAYLRHEISSRYKLLLSRFLPYLVLSLPPQILFLSQCLMLVPLHGFSLITACVNTCAAIDYPHAKLPM
jgi:hypothetical protein